MRQLERANPVPDPRELHVDPDADRYLSNLLATRLPRRDDAAPRRNTVVIWSLSAALVALLVGGVVLIGTQDDGDVTPVEEPTPTPEPSTPPPTQAATVTTPPAEVSPGQSLDDIPLVESGATYASPVGDITWTRIDGDVSSLPGSIDFESDGRFYGVDDDGTSWVSSGGIEWAQTDPLPGERGSYVNVGDEVWSMIGPARSGEPTRLGRWNGESFEPVDLSEIEPPDAPPGLRVVEEWFNLDSLGETPVVTAGTRFGLDPANDVMEFGDDVDMDDVGILWIDDTSYQVVITSNGAANNAGQEFTLSADSADPDLVSISGPDGNIVGRVGPWPGLDAEQLIEQLRSGGVVQRETFIGGDNGLERLQNLPSSLGELAGVGDVTLALGVDDQTPLGFSLWRTEDLSTWERVDIPLEEPGTIRWASLTSNGTEALLDLQIDPPMHGEVWVTDDGTTWRPTNVPRIWSEEIFVTDFGWVRGDEPWAGDSVWVSPDGIDWTGFGLGFDPLVDGGWTRSFALATQIFVIQQHGTDRTIWVGEVQPG